VGLWYKVLVAKYGEKEESMKKGGGRASVWWKDLWNIIEGDGGRDGG
ncbi:hypothetical protein A2U01_0053062, partial [Trifolium medium]|nr:hypothetical protein [Trifolium medium]